MKKKKYQGEPRCVFFSDKERPVRKKRRDEPIEKKEDRCEGKNVQCEKKRKREKYTKSCPFIGKCDIKATIQDMLF